MLKVITCICIASLCYCMEGYAQNYGVHNHYFLNPYVYNPAEVFTEYAMLNLSHRQQWMGIENAPSLSVLSFNTLVNETYHGFGGKISNYSRGILNTTDVGFTYAKGFPFKGENTTLYMGMTIGAISNSVNVDADVDLSDPVIATYLANNLQPAASFGMVLRSKSGLNISLALPQLFTPRFISPEHFSDYNVSPLGNAYASLYFKRKVKGKIVYRKVRGMRRRVKLPEGNAPLELYTSYKYSQIGTSQFEGLIKFNASPNFWLAAGYRQHLGLLANLGISVDKFLLSYSYEPGNQPVDGFSSGTHEIQLGFRIGGEKVHKLELPKLRSTIMLTPEEQHRARFEETAEDPDHIQHEESRKKKKYYVIIKGFTQFGQADDYKQELRNEKFNAEIYYHKKDNKFYVHVFSSSKGSDANNEAKNLKSQTHLKSATVLEVEVD